jgi:chromosome segregation ATPase
MKEQLACSLDAAAQIGREDEQLSELLTVRVQYLENACVDLQLLVDGLRKQLADEETECSRSKLQVTQVTQRAEELEAGIMSISTKLSAAHASAESSAATLTQLLLSHSQVEAELINTKRFLATSADTITQLNHRIGEPDACTVLLEARAIAAENDAA